MIFCTDPQFHMEEPCVVTFGKFDGIHLGHQRLIKSAVDYGRKHGIKVVLCSFDMRFWRDGIALNRHKIASDEDRIGLCELLGVDVLYEYPFDDLIAATEPVDFLNRFVKEKLKAAAVVVGTDWHFGSHRGGDAELLQKYSQSFGYEAIVVDKVLRDGREISSTWIREAIKEGDLELVNSLLGYEYAVSGTVSHGHGRGEKFNCPTINLDAGEDRELPPFGVYVSRVFLSAPGRPAEEYEGVTNVGVRPTVSQSGRISVETNILDFDQDVYGRKVKVALLHFVRPEKKFADTEELTTQLCADVAYAREYFHT